MLKVGDRVRILYAGPHSYLVGKEGTIVEVRTSPIEKYDYCVDVDGSSEPITEGFLKGIVPSGRCYFHDNEVEKIS
jgi:hypothetical protein